MRKKWPTVSNASEKQGKRGTGMSNKVGNTKVVGDLDRSSSKALDTGVVVMRSRTGKS